MSRLNRAIARTGYVMDNRIDALVARLRRRLGYVPRPLQIVPYRTYGRADEFFLAGRVLEDSNIRPPEDDDTLWENVVAMYRRFSSREVAGAQVRARYGADADETVSDDEGYYQFTLRLPEDQVSFSGWLKVPMEVVDTIERPGRNQSVESTPIEADVLIPPATARFGVISDIDDTVVVTHAPNFLKMARMVFLNNAKTRLPFPGVGAFYQALQQGATGQEGNPLFFVSSSAWNLYDLLVDFMELAGIPPAPLLLADYGANESGFLFAGHASHKLEQISRILDTYPTLPFLLIGDSGQRDPEIYHEVANRYPGRILAIYIRDVTQSRRDAEIEVLRTTLGGLPTGAVEVLLEADTLPAARHAAAHGWINPAALPAIEGAAVEDESAPSSAEAAVEVAVEAAAWAAADVIETVTGGAPAAPPPAPIEDVQPPAAPTPDQAPTPPKEPYGAS
jgi:phosphatidate phosphatase APP1